MPSRTATLTRIHESSQPLVVRIIELEVAVGVNDEVGYARPFIIKRIGSLHIIDIDVQIPICQRRLRHADIHR